MVTGSTWPSVFTEPHLVDELFVMSGKNPHDHFNYIKLPTRYTATFMKTVPLDAWHGREKFSEEMAARTGVPGKTSPATSKTKTVYDLTEEVFLQNSLQTQNFFTWPVFRGFPQRKDRRSIPMNGVNKSLQRSPMVKIFNRYATYNGSSPYPAPPPST